MSLRGFITGFVSFWIGWGTCALTADAEAKPRLHATYATCYNLGGYSADGTPVHRRMAASNFWPAGTKLRLVGPQTGPGGIRKYVVRDTGSALWDGHLDLWHHSYSGCMQFGKRPIKYKVGWSKT